MKNWLNLKSMFAVIAGGLLALAFAPLQYYPLAILCPAILLILWLQDTSKQAFWRGFFFGLGLFGVGASWIFVSIHEYGNTSAPLAAIFTAIFVMILALFPAAQGYVLTRLFPESTITKICLAFPSSWVIFEWIRSWFLTGFPWLFLGASQINSPLHSLAPIVGEYGLSFAVAFSSGLLVYALYAFFADKKLSGVISLLTLISLWGGAALLDNTQWTAPQGRPIKVSMVQGNIPQQLKWDPAYLQATLKQYYQLTESTWDSQIIIWPEAAIPLLLHDAKDVLHSLDLQAKLHHTTFITGIPAEDNFAYYNAMVVLGADQGTYYKRHLVPFGEYVPFESLLRGLIAILNLPMSDFSPGPQQQSILQAGNLKIAPFICYEMAYPELVLQGLPAANLLLTISNDAWFGHSFASAQHLQIGQLRALETGRYHLFGSNTGITAIITPDGKIQASAVPFQATVLTGEVRSMTGTTPFVWLGTMPIILAVWILFLAGFGWELRRRYCTNPTLCATFPTR